QANAYAERFVRSVREDCLDWLLIAGQRHLDRVLRHYLEYYNRERPHRGLDLSPPRPNAKSRASPTGPVERRNRLGGLLDESYRRSVRPNPLLTPSRSAPPRTRAPRLPAPLK